VGRLFKIFSRYNKIARPLTWREASRNRRLDYRAIYKTVTGELSDFEEFARQVTSHLE
jgi:hypothetical protein